MHDKITRTGLFVTISNQYPILLYLHCQRRVLIVEMLWIEPDGLDFVADSPSNTRQCKLFIHTIAFVRSTNNCNIDVTLFVHAIAGCRSKDDH